MKNQKLGWLLVIVLLVIFGGVAIAEEELTLTELAEQLAALALRVESLESFWQNSGSVELGNNSCAIAQKSEEGLAAKLQRETALKYFDEHESLPDIPLVSRVVVDLDANQILVVYTSDFFDGYSVTEIWSGCEFIGSSDWRTE